MGYFGLFVLLTFYAILLVFCRATSKKVLLTPEFVFILGFIPQLTLALLYVNKWELILSLDTFLVYFFGGLYFVMISLIIRQCFFSKKINVSNQNYNQKIQIKRWKLIVTIIFHIMAIVIMAKALINRMNAGNLLAAIELYTKIGKGQGLEFPSLPGKLNLFSYLSGFVWGYYLIHAFTYKYKTHYILLSVNLILSFISNMLTGSRGGVLQVILTMVFLAYILYEEKNGWRFNIRIKTLIRIIILGILLLIVFQKSLSWIGRSTETKSFIDYIALYVSAEVKNIDIRIREGYMAFRPMSNWSTLNRSLSKIYSLFGMDIKRYADSSTYITFKGIDLGNVYTIFYSFIRDLNYLGIFVFETIMAFISQLSLSKIFKQKSIRPSLHMAKMIYSYILTMLFYSFFSNWFFNNVISTGFVWCLITWFLFKLFLEKE